MNQESCLEAALVQPQFHKAKVSIWEHINLADSQYLLQCVLDSELRECLGDRFGLREDEDVRHAIILDLYCQVVKWAQSQNFQADQLSCFFSVVKNTHDICTETPFGNMTECFQFLKDAVLCHSVQRPPFSIAVFSPDQARDIMTFVIKLYFRHYKMYKYAFTPKVRMDIRVHYEDDQETETEVADVENAPSYSKPLDEQDSPETEIVSVDDQQRTLSPAANEPEELKRLKSIIEKQLCDQLSKIRATIDEKLKESENSLNEKFQETADSKTVTQKPGRKSPPKKK